MTTIRFNAEVSRHKLSIRISGDCIQGVVVRSEGAKAMSLLTPVYEAECESMDFTRTHPDLIALAAILVFHPVIPNGSTISFNFPISPQVGKALRRPYILPDCDFQGEGVAPSFTGQESVLSYGGGFDSLAAHVLFPGCPLVHQSPLSSGSREYDDVVNRLIGKVSPDSHVVRDNMREMWSIWGLPLWVSVFVPSLLLGAAHIISGSELTGTYLDGGKRWHPRYRNRWYEAFSAIGSPILPTSFSSEVLNAKICYAAGKEHLAAYCAIVRNQDCGACSKCLRRRLLRSVIDPSRAGELLNGFTRSAQVDAFMKQRPLYYGDVFMYAISRLQHWGWLHELTSDVSADNLNFHDRYFAETFDHFAYPATLKEQAESRMGSLGLEPMSLADVAAMHAFAQ